MHWFFRHLACEEERLEAARILVEHNASTTIKNKAGKTAVNMSPTVTLRSIINGYN